MTIIVPAWVHYMIDHCAVLDDTFSDTDRYPSLIEFEIRSLDVPGDTERDRETHIRLCLDEHLPRLRALGRLAVGDAHPVESTLSDDTFGSVADA